MPNTMKRSCLLSILFIAIVAFSCCQESNKYTITANFFGTGKFEGDKVYLLTVKGGIIVDSAVINNQSFVFEGVVPDTSVLRFVKIQGNYRPSLVFLEKGNIRLDLDTVNSIFNVAGTATNTSFQVFRDSVDRKFTESYRFYEQRQALRKEGKMSPEKNRELQDEQKADLNELEDYVCDFIKTHASNNLGEYVFNGYTNFFEDFEKLSELLPLFSEDYKQTDDYKKNEAWINARITTAEGKQFLDVKGQDLNGQEVSLSDYVGKGKVVLVDFWASWCSPCRKNMPELRELRKKYKNLEIVGISLDDNKDNWERASEYEKIDWPQFSNLKGWDEPASRVYGVRGIPHIALIDKDGTIVSRAILHSEALKYKIEELLD